MKYLGSKRLECDELILRCTLESDLKVLWKILCNRDVSKYYLVGKFNLNWEDEKKWQYKKLEHANDNDVFIWSIILKGENKCIGQVCCQKIFGKPDDIRDVGWFIDSNYQHKGYGSKAAKLMLDYMFNEVGILKIETCVEKNNVSSYKIMEKLGFKKTNIIRKVKYTFASEEVECLCYEISHDEYLNGFKN